MHVVLVLAALLWTVADVEAELEAVRLHLLAAGAGRLLRGHNKYNTIERGEIACGNDISVT